jgi:uncharacterized membrane protein YkoI
MEQPKKNPLCMKIKNVLATTLAAGLVAAGFTACVSGKQDQATLAASAKVPRADAEATALSKVPGGLIKDGELEKEKGRLIWSFDISIPGSQDIKEVAVDAITGAVVSVDTETPAQQAKEAAEDAAKEKKEKH